jgi:hypothetical protein
VIGGRAMTGAERVRRHRERRRAATAGNVPTPGVAATLPLTPDEARGAQARLTSTLARIQITRRRVDTLRARLTERDRGQAAVNGLIERLHEALPKIAEGADEADAALLREAVTIVSDDLGDLVSEAMRITRE